MYFTKWAYELTSRELEREQAEEAERARVRGVRPRKVHPVRTSHTAGFHEGYIESRLVDAFPLNAVSGNANNRATPPGNNRGWRGGSTNTNNSNVGNTYGPRPANRPAKRKRVLLKTRI